MATKKYVLCTLTNSVAYTGYKPAKGNEMKRQAYRVEIAGGANRMTRNLITPRGVVTEVTSEELALLEENKVFQRHMLNGFVSISDAKPDADKAAKDQAEADASAPLTKAAIEEDAKAAGAKAKGKK